MIDSLVSVEHEPTPPLLGDRLSASWAAVRSARGGLAVPAAACLGVAVTAIAAWPRTVDTGEARFRCGFDTALGHGDAVTGEACGGAGPRLVVAILGAAIALAAVGCLVVEAVRRSRATDGTLGRVWAAATASTADRVLLGVGLVAAAVVAFASVPAPYARLDGAPLAAGRCGVDSLVLGHPDPLVNDLCEELLAGRKPALVLAAPALLAAGAVLVSRVLRRAWSERSVAGAIGRSRGAAPLIAAGALALVLALLASRPVTLRTDEPASQVVQCGVDSWFVGGPTAPTRSQCRAAQSDQIAIGVAAASILLVLVGRAAVVGRQRPSGET